MNDCAIRRGSAAPGEPEDTARPEWAISRAAGLLHKAGIDTPRVDAELLAAHVLGVPRGRLLVAPPFTADQRAAYDRLVDERVRRVPLQWLTGTAPFRELEIAVGPGVFIPRPETELLVDWGLGVLPEGGLVVDLCAGSGAIALSVAHETTSPVYAVERDPTALEWLRRNAATTRVTIVDGDATGDATLSTVDGLVDVVLCNPPYVPSGAPVAPEVGAYDPAVAVFAGVDGLAVITPLIGRVARLLRPGGWFGVEHDDTHGVVVPELLRADGRFDDVRDHNDLTGRPRFATARRRA